MWHLEDIFIYNPKKFYVIIFESAQSVYQPLPTNSQYAICHVHVQWIYKHFSQNSKHFHFLNDLGAWIQKRLISELGLFDLKLVQWQIMLLCQFGDFYEFNQFHHWASRYEIFKFPFGNISTLHIYICKWIK